MKQQGAADSTSVLSTTVLLVTSAGIFGCWVVLGGWVLVERYLHDRFRDRARLDVAAWSDGRLELNTLGSRRLRRLALGPSSPAASDAASALVSARRTRLVNRARNPGNTNGRLQALTILVRAGFPGAVRLIRRAVAEGDPALTTSLLRLAGELQTEAADALLLAVLVDGTYPRARTATELEPRVARLRDELIELASDDVAALRSWAITLLTGQLADPAAARVAIALVGDDDANVRAAVAEALGHIDTGVARPLLRRLLTDDAFFVRSHAARSVARLGDGSLAHELLPLLADRNWWVRAAAKESLLRLGDDGLEAARAALGHPDRFARDGALEIILGSGQLQELVAAADNGDGAAEATVAAIRAQTSEWMTESLPGLPPLATARREAAAA